MCKTPLSSLVSLSDEVGSNPVRLTVDESILRVLATPNREREYTARYKRYLKSR